MTPKKIFITGKGQLGSFYKDYFASKGAYAEAFGSELNVLDYSALEKKIKEFKPDLVIHTAAKTNIDWCEENKTQCFEINTLGSNNVGRICAKSNIYLVHISSGCILESKNAQDLQNEEVKPSPLCFYSWTKVWSEELLNDLVKKENLKVLILRPRQLLSAKVDPRNALTKLLTYSEFIDEPNSCTVVKDLLAVTEELVRRDITGVYNVANPGVTTPLEIAKALKEIVKPDMEINEISNKELQKKTLAIRVNAVLDTAKLDKLGIKLKEIHERMREIMVELKESLEDSSSKGAFEKTKEETEKKLNSGS